MLSIILGIILALLVFGVIVFFHELGHFFSAKIFGVKVEEFGIGLPPRIITLYEDSSGTKYSLSLFPLGGFVKLKGEEFNETNVHDKDSLVGKPIWQQMIIVLAGVAMNILLAIIIISIAFNIGIQPIAINTKFQTETKIKLIPSLDDAIKIGLIKIDGLLLSPVSGSIAEKSGIKENDVLVSINNKLVKTPEEMINTVKYTENSLNFKIKRGTTFTNINITPLGGKIGSYVSYNITDVKKDFKYKYPFFEAINEGIKETYNQSIFTFELLGSLVKKSISPIKLERDEAVKSLGGPIALGNLFINLVNEKVAISLIVIIGALISINLGVFNLLPIPALDGGRFFIMFLNGIVIFFFGRKIINERVEDFIHISGFVLLIGLSIFVAYQDIWKIITG